MSRTDWRRAACAARRAAWASALAMGMAACDLGEAPAPEIPAASQPAPATWIDVTVGGIAPEDRRLLVLPPSGFLVDVLLPAPDQVLASSLSVSIRPWAGMEARGEAGGEARGREVSLREPLARSPDRVTFAVPAEQALAPGSYSIWARVERSDGATESVTLPVAVREPTTVPPLAGGQWIQLDFEADRDGDGLSDLPGDLATFGLASGVSPAVDIRIEAWVIDEIVERAAALYRANPSGLPDADPLAVRFSAEPPMEGPFSRICVAGATPGEDAILGNVLLDPGNQDRSDDACDDYLPSGVFPREITYYADDPSYQAAFGPLIEAPAGSDPLDARVLGPGYDSSDPAQRARLEALRRGVETFAQVVASLAAHEAGHAMGLVPPGAPGAGLWGGLEGADFTHNLTPEARVPAEKWLMNPGPSFSFDDLAGTGGARLPELRPLNFAYLQGRVILDPRVDGVYPPPRPLSVSPRTIETTGSLLTLIEIRGRGFRGAPRVLLRGPVEFPVLHVANLAGQAGAPDTLIGQVLVPTLIAGTYDVHVTNTDGQEATLKRALEVR